MNVYWTARAFRNLTSISDYIKIDNPQAAKELEDYIITVISTKLAAHPLLGKPGRVSNTRELVVHSSYIVVYRVTSKAIEIITIRHTAQLWPNHFR